MDNREAKFILGACRPGGQDAGDPQFAQALEQARRDPILQRWFQDSVMFDGLITARLGQVTPPADLRENILAGVKVSRASRRKNRLVKLVLAAAFLVTAVLGSLMWYQTRPTHLAGWQRQALTVITSLIRNESSFDAQSNHPGELVTWLRASHAPAAEKLPEKVEKLESLGCKKFSANGIAVSVICFTRTDGGLIHLVTTTASAPDRARDHKPEVVRHREWTTATWREGDKIYMLALEGSPDQLRSYL